MKIRTDFVTNSSSSSFGAAIVDVVASGVITTLGVGVIGAILGAGSKAGEQAAADLAAEEAIADEIEGAIYDSQTAKLNAQAEKLKAEINTYKNQWAEASKGVDPNDPNYANFKQQYDDYIDYLNNQLNDVNASATEIEATKMQEQIAREAKGEWVKQQEQDLVQVAEQKAFVAAALTGYGSAGGYDVSKLKESLQQLEVRERELRDKIQANGGDSNYTAKSRDPIGPDADSIRLNNEWKKQQQEFAERMRAAELAANKERREYLENKQKWLEKDVQTRQNQAAIWNVLTKGAEITKVGADLGVDILEKLTGPAGMMVKRAYVGLTPIAENVGSTMSEIDYDRLREVWHDENLRKAELADIGDKFATGILKGSVSGLTNVIGESIGDLKDTIGEPGTKALGHVFKITSSAGKGALDAGLDGKDITDGAIKGGLEGTLDVATGEILDNLIPGGEIPEGLDWSDVDAGVVGKSILSPGKYVIRNLGREALTEGGKGLVKNELGNFIKGNEILNTGWKQEFTGNAIEKLYTPAVRTAYDFYTPMAKQAADDAIQNMTDLANALKNSVNDPGFIQA